MGADLSTRPADILSHLAHSCSPPRSSHNEATRNGDIELALLEPRARSNRGVHQVRKVCFETNMGRTCNLVWLAGFALVARTASGGCPFLSGQKDLGSRIGGERLLSGDHDDGHEGGADYSRETYEAIQADIVSMFVDSKDFWPADFGNYGPLFIRLAWHCAGSYRASDGRGGCDGGRIRFFPEHGWADNTNLDKALTLLQPIKLKYGDAISWADLITLTGDMAISSMGGPILGFCAGRQDDDSGYDSLELGPTPEQEATAPCAVNGTCELPLGTSTVGLIYVNPGGPMGVPDPEASAPQIREVFSRMGMNDTETVALIGGGHAFGKVHGACPSGPGPDPFDAPEAPWPGTCGDPDSATFGRAENTFTSGFEGAWTEEPTVWDNSYFVDLLEYDWIQAESPAGNIQWIPVLKEDATETDVPDIIMLTSDVALLMDPEYLAIVEEFAADQYALDIAFSNAWYKLVTRDMGPHSRCVGTDVPPPQEFQLPLADTPKDLPSYSGAKEAIGRILSEESTYAPLFVTLAYQCASTFRSTDYMGGCNGARIRFPPQSEWASNAGLSTVAQMVALAGRPRSSSFMTGLGYSGSYTEDDAGHPWRHLCDYNGFRLSTPRSIRRRLRQGRVRLPFLHISL
ncbi:Catalase is an enzyme, present in all aerobic cells, that decomposes hydrogen peroxide to molecular [Ectocarpus siliculosus]|uniref:Catalase is an enzyme, present in all aerobic cells, that decomposes hydrogen peroxide to molecular n=1 Tax=Ectocarpus siliculosus TaxID=2880 RepID=D8LN39_ECTSI|nr:Catalase is an enzyme, present in all aerobic cells, that decomposes hydrogen peroxide to molecular [Ectocarpus siliculosus]|eukprot:CBN74802.1 Catalase is an enzyme, present in all aerobic cells, that decomposes hydrogen peroxide to molecular [Ectocarpus siliculosus]